MGDGPPRKSLFIGRWQPPHAGHIALIRTALDEGRSVVIGIMDTPQSERNPWFISTRAMWWRQIFAREIAAGRVEILPMPWIDEVCYGRDCGWSAREIRLPADVESVSGTVIRGRKNGIETEPRRG